MTSVPLVFLYLSPVIKTLGPFVVFMYVRLKTNGYSPVREEIHI